MIHPSVLREEDEFLLGARAVRREPNAELQKLAEEYAKVAGFPPIQETPEVTWDENQCRAIADQFEELKYLDDSDLVRGSYRALADELRDQYDFLSRIYQFEPYGEGDPVPYRDSQDMMDDVRDNHHLWVFTGGADHAYLSPEENYIFRGVHDLLGHAAHGYSFGPRGEENAWVEHSKLFTPLARAALTTETRGQNSWVNCGPNAHLPVAERPYAEQKGALLDEDLWTHPVIEQAYQDWPGFLYL